MGVIYFLEKQSDDLLMKDVIAHIYISYQRQDRVHFVKCILQCFALFIFHLYSQSLIFYLDKE